MSDEKKSKIPKSQQQAVNRWNAKNYDRMNIFVRRGMREKLKEIAAERGMSLNQLVVNAVLKDTGLQLDDKKDA